MLKPRPEIMPATQSATLVERTKDGFSVELHQGNGLVSGMITLTFRWDAATKTLRFWLDRRRHHDVEDAWGCFRLEPMGDAGGAPRAFLTYGALLDVGDGVVRLLFEGILTRHLLSIPQRLRTDVEAHPEVARLAANTVIQR